MSVSQDVYNINHGLSSFDDEGSLSTTVLVKFLCNYACASRILISRGIYVLLDPVALLSAFYAFIREF